ncbi:tRNA1(Val) (adenine(37)-N6)-methyltransferase [Pseudaestuariivita sp.]|uniref:tRNA1(Val) (adenine(37)-N6)-methyltransferase n=1 Tax=Pseudaestuariivita sp. TaxID=2211669 RepID=UPI0040598D05
MSVTCDAFLGGRLHLWQPMKGYRAGVDPVLLAASVEARAGQTVLDLGCGVGAIALCLHTRVPGLALAGVERQESYATLARRNAEEAGAEMQVWPGCLAALPEELKAQRFDHVVMNPPYYRPEDVTQARDAGKAAAFAEDLPLETWCKAAHKRLKPGGWLWMVLRAERLQDAFVALGAGWGRITVRPVAPRLHRPAKLVLIRARHGGRADPVLLAPLVLHAGDSHADGGAYTAQVEALLRDGTALGWNDQIPGIAR